MRVHIKKHIRKGSIEKLAGLIATTIVAEESSIDWITSPKTKTFRDVIKFNKSAYKTTDDCKYMYENAEAMTKEVEAMAMELVPAIIKEIYDAEEEMKVRMEDRREARLKQ